MTLVADFNPAVAVTFQRMRALLLEGGGGLQEGVLGAGDLKGSQRAAGANLSADVAAGVAWVTVDTGARNGATHIYNDAVFNAGPFTAGHATLPRIDQVVLRYNDSAIPTGAGNTPTIEVLTGTATSGATLDNRLGATALLNDCVRLCDVLMPAVAASVTTANIRDRRPWARGAYWQVNSNGALGNFTTTSLTAVQFASGAFDARIECSGAPLEVDFMGTGQHSVAGGTLTVHLLMDGVEVRQVLTTVATAAGAAAMPLQHSVVPVAGSHLFQWQWQANNAGTATMLNGATQQIPTARYREVVRSNTNNT
jgi:hypothetical protein